jgi:KDO2-lipid IV(A) lauroyltransferase
MAVLPRFPRRAAASLARLLGHAAYYVSRHLRRVGFANLDIAYGETLSRQEKKRILKQSFRTFALTMLDLFWFNEADKARKYVDLDASYDRLKNGTPTVCISGHLGNWELLGQAVALRVETLTSVAAPLENQRVDDIYNRSRRQTGQTVVYKAGAMRKLLKALKRGEPIAILLDQNTKPSRGGVFVPFFGLPVPISSIAGSLVPRTGAALCFGSCVADNKGHYTAPPLRFIELDEPSENETRSETAQCITAAIAKVIEEEIRKDPGQWLWMYKRWKYVAPGHENTAYPFYAKTLWDTELRALEKQAHT